MTVYYGDYTTPPLWLDILFYVFVGFINLFYSFLFIRKSLRPNINLFTNSSDLFSCCCDLISWNRTLTLRILLRLFLALCCLYSFVLWICYGANILLEFFVSLFTYNINLVGFFFIPVILFISFILPLGSYHVLILSFVMHFDVSKSYISTCWRLWLFTIVIVCTFLAILLDAQSIITSLFWTVLLRYMTLVGVFWNLQYFATVILFLSIVRYRTLKSFKAKRNFLLFYHGDSDDFSITWEWTWRHLKFYIMMAIIGSFIILLIAGFTTHNNFLLFLCICLVLYYVCNLIHYSKPKSLFLLLRDGRETVSKRSDEEMNEYNKLKTVKSNATELNLTIELAKNEQNKEKGGNQQEKNDDNVTKNNSATLVEAADNNIVSENEEKKIVTDNNGETNNPEEENAANVIKNDPATLVEAVSNIALESEGKKIATDDNEATSNPQKENDSSKSEKNQGTSLFQWSATVSDFQNYWETNYYPGLENQYDDANAHKLLNIDNYILVGVYCCKNLRDYKYKGSMEWSWKEKRCCRCCKDTFNYILDHLCNILLLVAIIVFLFSFLIVSVKFGNVADTDSIDVDYNISYRTEPSENTYPICYSSVVDKITPIDLAILTVMAYDIENTNNDVLRQEIVSYFNGRNQTWELKEIRSEKPAFFHIQYIRDDNNSYNIDIISVRGTQDKVDILQDLALWTEIGVMQGISYIFPFLSALPVGFIRNIIYISSKFNGLINKQIRERFDKPVFDYARNITRHYNDNNELIILGHSLGGGIAQIVAANLFNDSNIPYYVLSFGLCSPGTLYTSKKFGYSTKDLDYTSMSILPQGDMVSAIDTHGGDIQYTLCDSTYIVGCHSSKNAFCDLLNNCGSFYAANSSMVSCYCESKTKSLQSCL